MSAVACVVIGSKIWATPVRYLEYSSLHGESVIYRSFSEVSGLGVIPLVAPVALAVLATWASWRRRLITLMLAMFAFLAFCLLTGFSIGAMYVPIAKALIVATLIDAVGRIVKPSHII